MIIWLYEITKCSEVYCIIFSLYLLKAAISTEPIVFIYLDGEKHNNCKFWLMRSLTKHRSWPVLLGLEDLLNTNVLFLYGVYLGLEGYFEVFC